MGEDRRHVYFGVWRKRDGKVYPVRTLSFWDDEQHARNMAHARMVRERLAATRKK